MARSVFLFQRKTQAMDPGVFDKLSGQLGIRGETVRTEEALFKQGDGRAVAYAQPRAKFAGLLFFTNQSASLGECTDRLIGDGPARDQAHRLLDGFGLLPQQKEDDKVRLELELVGEQKEAVVFDGRERRRAKVKTDVSSRIALNGIPVVGPRGKVRMTFKGDEQPVLVHASLWESLSVYEERELVSENDVVRVVHDRLQERGERTSRSYLVRDVRLVYFADEYRGGPDLLAPEYHVEVELRDPRYRGRDKIQGPRQVVRLPACR